MVEAADNEVDNDENEFILDAQEADIPRIKAKPANKTLPKMPNLNQPLPPPVLRSLFSFSALRHSRSSIKNPIHYGTAIIKSRMAMELRDHPIDISVINAPVNVSIALKDAEILLDKHKIPLDVVPHYNLGDPIAAADARHILVLTSWRSGSTFLGDILNHYPGTFYSFEPLHYISRLHINMGCYGRSEFMPCFAY